MNTLVNTAFGQLQGFEKEGVVRFLGVPFAQPPLGDLRFRAPVMVKPWEGVREAKSFARDPMQANLLLGPENYSEDCLYLNVWVPENGGEKMPVMIWVPGGAFATGGSGALADEGPTSYDCARIARDTGCVIVSVSYRLNVFGFLNLSSFSDRFDDNIGMKDVIMAMRWVKETISSFGGDPDNVTLFGESAGGGVISGLLLVEEAQPYYHRAIIQSNCFDSFYTAEEEKEICELYLGYAGVDRENPEALLDVPYEKLIEAGRKLDAYAWEHYTGRCSFCPVVDGDFLPDFPTLADFSKLNKPVLVGSNKIEGNFQAAYTWLDTAKYSPLVLRRLTPEQQEKCMAYYPGLPEDKVAFGELLTDTMYTFPKIRFAERLARGGNPVYLYRSDFYTTVLEKLGLYACHVSELLALFEFATEPFAALFAGDEEQTRLVGDRMRRYWGAFAHTGNPNVEGQVEWKPYTEDERNTLVIDHQDHAEVDPEAHVRERYEGFDRLLI